LAAVASPVEQLGSPLAAVAGVIRSPFQGVTLVPTVGFRLPLEGLEASERLPNQNKPAAVIVKINESDTMQRAAV
jgi:hypothetical protein